MSKTFWEQVYSTRQAEKLGWYQPRFDLSLDWMHEIELADHAVIIDVGGGALLLREEDGGGGRYCVFPNKCRPRPRAAPAPEKGAKDDDEDDGWELE